MEEVTKAGVEVITNTLTNSKGFMRAFDDLIEITYGGLLHRLAERKRIDSEFSLALYYEEKQREFEKELKESLEQIPDEDKQIPNIAVVGPALEASKFYVGEDEIKDMFIKLITSACDIRKNNYNHKSNLEIVKQLSPLDAKIFRQMYLNSIRNNPNPMIQINKENDNRSNTPLIENLYNASSIDLSEHKVISSSIINLRRLGLIDVPEGTFYTVDAVYNELENHPFVTSYIENFKYMGLKIGIERRVIAVNDFGKNFGKSVL